MAHTAITIRIPAVPARSLVPVARLGQLQSSRPLEAFGQTEDLDLRSSAQFRPSSAVGWTSPSTNMAIDPAFVVVPELRPKRRHAEFGDDGPPLIDLSFLGSGAADSADRRAGAVEGVRKACKEWGFFQIENHGVRAELLDELEASMKAFFALPAEEKRRVGRTADSPTVGFFDSERTKNVRDWKEVFDFVHGSVEMPLAYDAEGRTLGTCVYSSKWPDLPFGFRDSCTKWSEAMDQLAFELVGLVTESLGLPATLLHEHFRGKSTAFGRMNYYPACPSPDLALGVNGHKDGGGLTILWQDEVGGLQVKRKDGEWISVAPRRHAFVVNLGDLFQVWSNDKYLSVEHRAVVNEKQDRYSVPYFFNPRHTATMFPLPGLLDDKHSTKYRPFNWGYALKKRKDANVRDIGEICQVSNFATERNLT